MPDLPLSGFRIGVTAARKADEQVTLLERRGAAVEWAPALSLDPNQIDDEALRASTEEVLSRPVDMFLATTGIGMKSWFAAVERWGLLDDLLAALVAGSAVAIFRTHDGNVYAMSNYDPVACASVLARGIVGTRGEIPVVASPMHKQAYDLRTGQCLDDAEVRVTTYDVHVADGMVLVGSEKEGP